LVKVLDVVNTVNAIDLVVFDMIGTTIEDRGQVVGALLAALHEYGIDVTAEELRGWRGASKRDLLRHFHVRQGREQAARADAPAGTDPADQLYASFRRHLQSRSSQSGAAAVPGAEETFAWLHEHDIKIALTTGFERHLADMVLRAVGWKGTAIDATVCSDEVARGRPAPYMIFRAMEATGVTDVRRVVKVGDTVVDLQAGVQAGVCAAVGVLTGAHSRGELERVGQAYIIGSVAELPALLERSNDQVNGPDYEA
jgi:phosphonatase-like hydrolase